ncbi:DNase I-like protein [Dothidotthia symphoricarpi CBS 119687]|uniref:DNase I-like protein n=1 Tax=Dothidotthia symphoricarpi CBS 119687 TaxID=1392245 RepID=A0A6A6AC20_9PLEO|nr:DNase I-like protein [Dothidotthia symphoricarpi CBS 119687]KAF2128554.1 DNase I-like protein [Dothidotthia symphoricarpi CBS 119687]
MSSRASSLLSPTHIDSQIPGAFPGARSISGASITTQQATLSQILYDRREEYTRPRDVRIKIGTWNVAGLKGTEQDVGGWFVKGKGVEEALAGLGVSEPDGKDQNNRESVAAQEARHTKRESTLPRHDVELVPAGEEIGLYVLGLQEIVDITSAAEALRPYTDPSVANKWKAAIETELPEGYQLVSEQQLIGLWLVIYASPAVLPQIKNVSTTSVGTGLMGYMGNKGAVTTRIVLGETTRLVFVNSHLGAGADKAAVERRNWDVAQIASRTRFDPITDSLGSSQSQGEGLGDEELAFWFGDLNYRLSGMPGDDVRRLLTVHTKDFDHEDESRPSTSGDSGYGSKMSSEASEDSMPLPPELDPASVQTTISSLLPHDELRQQMKAGKAFHDGWEEGPIRFLPSYKYDIGKVGVFDSSEKRRCPSWCDRILYRTRAAKLRYDAKLKDQENVRMRDEEMKAKGMDMPGDDDVLWDYDPAKDGDNEDYDEIHDPEPEPITTKDGFSDEVLLEYYTTHLRVLSSDHKPLDAVFSLKYDAVVPKLKAGIHAEVARELDRQENEGRPSIAVVVDRRTATASLDDDDDKTDSSFDGVDFGNVKFAKSKRRTVTIANTGRVPATFGFADRPVAGDEASGAFPPWLSVTFDREPDKRTSAGPDDIQERYTLQPADVVNAELKLKIDLKESVRNFNDDSSSLEEILVLRVEGGRDHFLPIRGRWLKSALARTVDKLIKIPEGGIRKLQHQMPDRADGSGVMWSVPREIFRLTESIEDLTERTLAEWDMTKAEGERAPWQDNAGWPFVKSHMQSTNITAAHEDEIAEVYDAVDCDTPFANAFQPETRAKERVEILAEVLMTFLSSLTDGVITKSLWEKLEEMITTREKAKQQVLPDDEKMAILEIMASAPNHNATFLLLLSMMQNLTKQVVDASKPKPDTPRASTELPGSPEVSVRRRTLSKVPEVAIRQLINRNYATVFAQAMFRCKDDARMKEKDKATRKERMIRVVEVFLNNDE